jgi:hypothetical protein
MKPKIQSIGKLHLRFSTYGSIGQNLLWMKKITFNIEYIFNLVMPLFTKRGTAFPLKDITMKRMSYLFSHPESAICQQSWMMKKDQVNKRIVGRSSFRGSVKWKWVYIKKFLHDFQHGVKYKIKSPFWVTFGGARSSGIGSSEEWFLKQEEWMCQFKQDSKVNLWLTCYNLIYISST